MYVTGGRGIWFKACARATIVALNLQIYTVSVPLPPTTPMVILFKSFTYGSARRALKSHGALRARHKRDQDEQKAPDWCLRSARADEDPIPAMIQRARGCMSPMIGA